MLAEWHPDDLGTEQNQQTEDVSEQKQPKQLNGTSQEFSQELNRLYQAQKYKQASRHQQEFELHQLAKTYDFPLAELRTLFQDYCEQQSIDSSDGLQQYYLKVNYGVRRLFQQTGLTLSKLTTYVGIFAGFWGLSTSILTYMENSESAKRQVIYKAWEVIKSNEEEVLGEGSQFRTNNGIYQALEDLNQKYHQNLSGLSLTQTNLTRIQMEERTDLSYSNFRKSNLSYAQLYSVNLNASNLEEAKFFKTNLQNALLKNAQLNKAELDSAKLQGANLTGAELKEAELFNTQLMNANLSNADLSGAQLHRADLSEANLKNVIWNNTDLNLANLSSVQNLDPEAVKTAKNFWSATYSPEMRLKVCWNYGGNLTLANLNDLSCSELYRKQLNGVDLSQLDLSESQLLNAEFKNANLQKTNFQNAQLFEANLEKANLEEANFKNARLDRANLKGANLKNAQLEGAELLCANLSAAQNLEPEQVKKAQNWRAAIYSKEVNRKLGLDKKPTFRVCQQQF